MLSAVLTCVLTDKAAITEMRCRPGVVENAQVVELTHEG